MKREPTQEERKRSFALLPPGTESEQPACIFLSRVDLTEAQKFIKALTTDLELELPEKFAKSQHKRRWV